MATRIYLLGLLLILPCVYIQAQPLSQAEAIIIAGKLREKKILNEAGQKLFIEVIQKQELTEGDYSYGRGGYLIPSEEKWTITKASILRFCALVFLDESMYRSGLNGDSPSAKAIDRATRKLQRQSDDNYARYERWQDRHNKKLQRKFKKQFEKLAYIENNIPAEDSVFNGWTAFPPMRSFNSLPGKKNTNYIDASRSVWGKTRTRTARDLYAIGLIDKPVLNKILLGIHDGSLLREADVCDLAGTQSAYRQHYPVIKQNQLALLDSLAAHHVLSKSKHEALVRSYGDYELKSDLDIVSYAEHSVILDTQGYDDPVNFIPVTFEAIKKILPDFDYTGLAVQADTTEKYGMKEAVLITTFSANGKMYRYKTLYDYVAIDSLEADAYDKFQVKLVDFQTVFNKWLIDQNSPQRIYRVTSSRHQIASEQDTRIAFIALTREQRNLWPDMAGLSVENHNNRFNSAYIENVVNTLDSLGLFSHLSAAQKDSAKHKMDSKAIIFHGDLLTAYPHLVHLFDWETTNFENPYEAHTLAFAKISRGAFTPTQLKDNFAANFENEKKKIRFSFDFNGKHYTHDFENYRDWLDTTFLELIQQALRENNVNGGYYLCVDRGQEVGYIFLTLEQHRFLKGKFPELLTDTE